MNKTINNMLCLLLCIFIFGEARAQYSKNLIRIDNEIKSREFTKALKHLQATDTILFSQLNNAYYHFLTARSLALNNQDDKAFRHYIISRKKYLAIDSLDIAMTLNLEIAFLISSQENNISSYKNYIDEYFEYAKEQNKPHLLAQGYSQLAIHNIDNENYETALKLFRKALLYNKEKDDRKLESTINNNIAVLYNEALNKPDSALYYLKKDLDYIISTQNVEDFCYNYTNQAASYYYKENYAQAIKFLKKADSLPITKNKYKTKYLIYEFLYINYEEIADYKNAYNYMLLNKAYGDSLNAEEQNIAIKDIQTKYQTKEKELENQLLKGKVKTNKILLYTFIGLLLASLAIVFLIVKNSRKKEKILQQEKLIEQQKLEKAMKEHELSSIDSMLEGQEKERQRLANDLHDNLGSMLATLKLNFEHLRFRKHAETDEKSLYSKTDELIAEAYQKVRSIAHARNAGVFANEGLIPAVKKLADKISLTDALKIDVVTFGFNERLENTMEITIFRMIQELATNIIKYAGATEASIQLTRHDDVINIIVEDNGKGFNTAKVNYADGMGLQSIMKKTEQLDGNFTVDSTPGKGTTILIDIPL